MSDEKKELPKYIVHRPKDFNPDVILVYLDTLDKHSINAENDYDEVKDQVQEVLDFVISEKVSNNNCSIAQAKVQATNDERYKKVKALFRKQKAYYQLKKIEAKNGHSYCDNLKQQSINQLAIDKLTIKN